MKYKIFRALVCFLVICCILLNCSPIRAKAVVTEAIVVTGAGVFATMFAIAMGIVAVDLTVQLINGIGKSMENHLRSSTTGTESEILDVWIEPLHVGFNGDIDDSQNGALAGLFSIPKELLDNLLDWGKSLINGEGIEVEQETVDGLCVYDARESFNFSVGTSSSSRSVDVPYSVIGFMGYLDNGSQYLSSIFVCSNTAGHIVQDYSSLKFSSTYNCYYHRIWFTSGQSGPYPVVGNFPVIDLGNSIASLVEYDTATTEYACSWFTNGSKVLVYPDTYIGDIPQQVKDGTFDEEKFVLPSINYGQLFQGQRDPVTALNNLSSQLQNQTMTYEQYMELVRSEVNAGSDTEDDEAIGISGTLADTETKTFFESLINVITAPFEWIWSKVEVFFGPWIDTISEWFADVGSKIESIPSAFSGWFSDVIEGVLSIPGSISDVFSDVISGVIALPTTIYNAIVSGLEALFVPSEGYIDAKVDALTAEYAFADSIAHTGLGLKQFFSGLGSKPPIIYIDLGASTGSHNIGGKTVFVDLTWYAQYKPTLDTILSGFLWLWFVWRMLLSLPGIIQGTSGMWGSRGAADDTKSLVPVSGQHDSF